MKRFALFGAEDFYAGGGWRDFIQSFDSVEEAIAFLDANRSTHENFSGWIFQIGTPERPEEDLAHWWHIVDLTTGDIVRDGHTDDA